ncbi:MAG: radical SAM protein [Bacteroidales bacterium]|jgi:radical SAM protein with 4Fe4S-binding SPASM domain|nr:radical SAM protein [Bacteroidales bacterium]
MGKINITDTYIINPAYKIRNDKKRCVITNNNSFLLHPKWEINDEISENISWTLNPYLEYIFSFFDGKRTLEKILEEFVEISDLSKEELFKIFSKFIENKENQIINISYYYSPIPKRFLIKKTKKIVYRNILEGIDISTMLKDVDMQTMREYIPNSIVIMVNNTCVTDCIYCYANTSHKVEKSLSFERIKEIIKEASLLGMNDVEIGGGDFFVYKHWKKLLPELIKYEYAPYISTKVPITQEIIDVLKANNIKGIQLSIDSVDNDEIQKILNVDEKYLEKVKHGVKLLDDAKIEITIKPVITKYNDSIASVTNLLNFLSQFEMVKTINIAPGSYSIYKPFNFSSNVKKIDKIRELVKSYNTKTSIKINVQGGNTYSDKETRLIAAKGRKSLCSGNVTSFYVLPDGKVTICEQMYWHPFFILGDLSKQSIMEVWNSEKALNLWNFSQEEVKTSSPCKTCNEFEKCRRGLGNCWRFAIAAYGEENYDYPSPDCPYAPEVTKPYFTPDE